MLDPPVTIVVLTEEFKKLFLLFPLKTKPLLRWGEIVTIMIHKEAYISTVHYMVGTSRICDVHDMEEHYLTPQCKECCCALMVIAQVVLSDICRTSTNRLDIAPVQFTFNLLRCPRPVFLQSCQPDRLGLAGQPPHMDTIHMNQSVVLLSHINEPATIQVSQTIFTCSCLGDSG